MNYFTIDETEKLLADEIILQAAIGMKSCKTLEDACKIIKDVWNIAQSRKVSA